MGMQGLFLAVHLLLAFITFIQLSCLPVRPVVITSVPQGRSQVRSGLQSTRGTAPPAPVARSSSFPPFMKIASFADGDKCRQTNIAQPVKLLFLLRTQIAWSTQSIINRLNFQ